MDYDADGDIDLLWVNHQSLVAFDNDGNGNLTYADNAVNGLPGSGTSKTGDYAAFTDLDADGDVDFLARLEDNTDLWINNGGTFSANAFDEAPLNNNKGGVAFCDFDADGDFDFVWTDAGVNQIWEQTGLGSTTFAARGVPLGITGDIDGVACGDIDNDGDVDLLLTSDVNDHLFRNDGGFTFTDVAPAAFGADDGEGAAFADYDRDGDLDLLINQDSANELWRNDTNNANYLVVRALYEDTVKLTTRDALGATITLLDCQGNLMAPIRDVNGGRGHGSQDPSYVHFGLPLSGTPSGPAGEYILRVEFVGGGVVGKAVVPANIGGYQLVTVTDTDANDFSQCTTSVSLASFEAEGRDGAIELRWQTASELDNLGFHLYRAEREEGPYARITTRPFPGLGTSLTGGGYTYRDEGLPNGATFYYELEDIETTGRTKRHGPVSATTGPSSSEAPGPSTPGIWFGDPEGVELRVIRRSEKWLVVELATPGFFAELQSDGRVVVRVPALKESFRGLPALRYPLEREGVLARIEPMDVVTFSTMTPVLDPVGELVGLPTGTVRRQRRAPRSVSGFARALGDSLQLSPFGWDANTGELRLATRLRVSFQLGREGRNRFRRASPTRDVTARLETREPGLYAFDVSKLVAGRRRRRAMDSLKLSRLGTAVPYHRHGSVLFFLSAGADANPNEHRAVYELEVGEPYRMEERSAPGEGPRVPYYRHLFEREEQRYYQAGLLSSDDVWLWDLLFAPQTRDYELVVSELADVAEDSVLTVWLQGTSDASADPDHHVRLFVNDSLVTELSWNGKRSRRIETALVPGLLEETGNTLTIENVGDTAAPYSMVMLDRFELEYPRRVVFDRGILEGRFSLSGTVELEGDPLVLDVTDETPIWLEGGTTGFRSESDRRYFVVSPDRVLEPTLLAAPKTRLRSHGTDADFVVIGPREFLQAAKPLLDLRRREGLSVLAANIEDVYSEFGHGEARPESVAEFLQSAPPHYVLLLGDATYDPKDYLGTGKPNFVPARMVRTDHLWTASDPSYATLDHDEIPDLAIGRIPATSVEDVEAMVAKILRYESESRSGRVVVVADNADRAGDFEGDAQRLVTGVLEEEDVYRIGLSWQSPSEVREDIRRAFVGNTGIMSYLGHGGIHLWADENVWNLGDVRELQRGEALPIVVTMNCLNGYFHFPYFDALAEALVKAPDHGAVAAISPSGLSSNGPAHVFHESLLEQVLHGGHERLGDVFLTAQRDFAGKSSYKELLELYHLFGDPTLVLR